MVDPQAEAALAALRTLAHDRTGAQIAALVAWCRVRNLGSALGGSVNLDLLCRAMMVEEYEEDHILFRQGDAGSIYYIVFSGEVAIYVLPALKPTAEAVMLASRLMKGPRPSFAKAGSRGSEKALAAASAAPPPAGMGRRGSCRAIAAAALAAPAEKEEAQASEDSPPAMMVGAGGRRMSSVGAGAGARRKSTVHGESQLHWPT